MAPTHTIYAMLHADIERYEKRCASEVQRYSTVHVAAMAKVKSVVTLLWPRAQVKPFGSFATGMMRPGSDIDLVVTLPPVPPESNQLQIRFEPASFQIPTRVKPECLFLPQAMPQR